MDTQPATPDSGAESEKAHEESLKADPTAMPSSTEEDHEIAEDAHADGADEALQAVEEADDKEESEAAAGGEEADKEQASEQAGKSTRFEGGTKARDINIEQNEKKIEKTLNRYYNLFAPGASGNWQDLEVPVGSSSVSFVALSREEIIDRSAHIIADEETVERLEAVLIENRCLLLTGPPHFGKAELLLLLASRLTQKGYSIREIAWTSKPEKNVFVDLKEIGNDQNQFGNKFVIFKDALSLGNRTLTRFVSSVERHEFENLTRNLKANGTFLVLTSDSLLLKPIQNSLAALGAWEEVIEISEERLVRGLEDRIGLKYPSGKNGSQDGIGLQDVLKRKVEIVRMLKTMPRIVRFVERSLDDVLAGEYGLEKALQRSGDLKDWFFSEVSKEFDAWCFGLALLLSYSAPPSRAVGFLQFHDVWNAVSRFMQRELRFSRRNRQPDSLLTDETLLELFQAEIGKSHNGTDYIRFKDASLPQRLWQQVLLRNCRSLVSQMYPWLLQETQRGNLHRRLSAAGALGRIGEMDPEAITLPLISTWGCSKELDQRALVGSLLQGVLGGERLYQDRCFKRLHLLMLGTNTEVVEGAIFSLLQVGLVDLGRAMQELEFLVKKRFAQKLSRIGSLEQDLRRAGREFAQAVTHGRAERLSEEFHRELLFVLLNEAFRNNPQEGLEILSMVQFTIVGLCFSVDTIDVLANLGNWMFRDPKGVAPLIGLLFLRDRGIADLLLTFKVNWAQHDSSRPEGESLRCNRIIAALVFGVEDSVRTIKSFLIKVFRSCSVYPYTVQESLRRKLMRILKELAEQSLPDERCKEGVISLFAALLASPESELSEQIFRMLNENAKFAEAGSDLEAFAEAVLTQHISVQ